MITTEPDQTISSKRYKPPPLKQLLEPLLVWRRLVCLGRRLQRLEWRRLVRPGRRQQVPEWRRLVRPGRRLQPSPLRLCTKERCGERRIRRTRYQLWERRMRKQTALKHLLEPLLVSRRQRSVRPGQRQQRLAWRHQMLEWRRLVLRGLRLRCLESPRVLRWTRMLQSIRPTGYGS